MQTLMSSRGLGALGVLAGGFLIARPALALRLLRLLPTGTVARRSSHARCRPSSIRRDQPKVTSNVCSRPSSCNDISHTPTRQFPAIQRGAGDAAAHAAGIVHPDKVARRSMQVGGFETSPAVRNAGLDRQLLAPQMDPQNAFHRGAVHPTGRAGVPGPSAAAVVRSRGIHVGAHHVGFNLVALDGVFVQSVIDGVHQVEQFNRPVAIAQQGKRQRAPHCPMGVLAAVLSQSGG